MKIHAVDDASPAGRAGVRAGDELVSVNGVPIRDGLDYLFASAAPRLLLRIRRADHARVVRIVLRRDPGLDLGIELSVDPVRRCGNNCIFCFIDQNPKALRRSLHVKDEDYRLSLLFGNYVTLTNVRPWEVERILSQRISPLYVSVHATRPEVRRALLRCPRGAEILPLLRRLVAGGIRLHAQIVVVPGYNDGAVLDETLNDLEDLHPGLRSVAVVPVGLTRHRRTLPPLRMVRRTLARCIVAEIEARQQRALRARGTRLHFLADEFYLLAEKDLPAYDSYEDFPQIDNGVGMLRDFELRLKRMRRLFPALSNAPRKTGAKSGSAGVRSRVLLASGIRFASWLERWVSAALARTGEGERVETAVLAIQNRLFGRRVTTAGLLAGRDVAEAFARQGRFDLAVLPPEMFNADGLTLDGIGLQELATAIGGPVQIGLGSSSRRVAATSGPAPRCRPARSATTAAKGPACGCL
ncbi:MAG: DUF512 domain-containing protein [Candidatus Eisenbacteria bacterium]